MTVSFEGTTGAADLASDPPSLIGTWQTNGGPIERGEGTFEATLAPP